MRGAPPPFTRMSSRPNKAYRLQMEQVGESLKLNALLVRSFDMIHSHKAKFIFTLSQY